MGRPPLGRDRPTLSLRTSPGLRAKLEEAAARSGRSISQEAEWFLESGMVSEETKRGPSSTAMLKVINSIFDLIEQKHGPMWHKDSEANAKANQAVKLFADAMMPVQGWPNRRRSPARLRRRANEGYTPEEIEILSRAVGANNIETGEPR